jgi:tRNA nucleotidyltransferase (CCA-adding enzyme)
MNAQTSFQTYLVGGAVRDALLGFPVEERDWVVVGATPDDLLVQGYRPVGRDFPVFLHPVTREEYALARTERKTAQGYRGFAVHAAPDITLEQDLLRRDLTINAMAQDVDGHIVDPYGGRRDLGARVLRHVSPAFSEDPVRVLRVARFAARYAHLGFVVAEDTCELIKTMAASGELNSLVAERVWAELVKALDERIPSQFFYVLRACGALAHLFPEIDRLFGVPQPEVYHPEIDTGVHTLMVLQQAANLTRDTRVRFAALTHDLGKGLTPEDQWPGHRGHEERGLAALDTLCERLKTPVEYRRLARRVMMDHGNCHRARELRSATLVDLLQRLDVFRQPENLDLVLLACEADAKGRTGHEDTHYPQADWLRRVYRAAISVSAKTLAERGYEGEKLGRELRRLRIQAIDELKRQSGMSSDG